MENAFQMLEYHSHHLTFFNSFPESLKPPSFPSLVEAPFIIVLYVFLFVFSCGMVRKIKLYCGNKVGLVKFLIWKPAGMLSGRDSEEEDEGGTVQLRERNQSEGLPRLPWSERWLNGKEYALMLLHADQYCQKFQLERLGPNQHPPEIYQRPQNGTIYFLRSTRLESLAFPRTPHKKTYCWKKMNFPTLIPKTDPQVKYLVASSFLSGRLHQQGPVFRMHVVRPLKFDSPYLLCHLRQVDTQGKVIFDTIPLKECFPQQRPDFYRLFRFLHNHCHPQ